MATVTVPSSSIHQGVTSYHDNPYDYVEVMVMRADEVVYWKDPDVIHDAIVYKVRAGAEIRTTAPARAAAARAATAAADQASDDCERAEREQQRQAERAAAERAQKQYQEHQQNIQRTRALAKAATAEANRCRCRGKK